MMKKRKKNNYYMLLLNDQPFFLYLALVFLIANSVFKYLNNSLLALLSTFGVIACMLLTVVIMFFTIYLDKKEVA